MTSNLRDKDKAVLHAIEDGARTVSEIKEATTLTNREINYSLTEYSLEQLGLVEIQKREGRERREVNGEERYIWKPKTVELTDQAIKLLADLETEDQYEDMSKREIIERVEELEQRQDRTETMFKEFKDKVMDRLSQG